MRRAPSTFRESDVKRALRAIERAGQKAASVEIEGGCIKIRIKNGNDDEDTANDNTDVNNPNPWDKIDK